MIMNREPAAEEGEVLLVDKPKGWTSFDVVNRIRGILRCDRVGHAGTLDPAATGLLIVCTGRMTKDVRKFVGLEKEYAVEMILGARTESFDAETPVIETHSTDDITEDLVRSAMEEMVGYREQLPPMWSAAKMHGRRLYEYARKGQVIERKARDVYIRSILPTWFNIPEVHFTVVCSKGTYVRALVDDIGKRLGCGAYVTGLRRVRIGDFHVRHAVTIEDLVRYRGEYRNWPHEDRTLSR
jgi:tRNA pseudouridine55 synthase